MRINKMVLVEPTVQYCALLLHGLGLPLKLAANGLGPGENLVRKMMQFVSSPEGESPDRFVTAQSLVFDSDPTCPWTMVLQPNSDLRYWPDEHDRLQRAIDRSLRIDFQTDPREECSFDELEVVIRRDSRIIEGTSVLTVNIRKNHDVLSLDEDPNAISTNTLDKIADALGTTFPENADDLELVSGQTGAREVIAHDQAVRSPSTDTCTGTDTTVGEIPIQGDDVEALKHRMTKRSALRWLLKQRLNGIAIGLPGE